MLAQTTGFINSGNLINGVIEPIAESYFISTNPANQRDEIGKFSMNFYHLPP